MYLRHVARIWMFALQDEIAGIDKTAASFKQAMVNMTECRYCSTDDHPR